MIRRSPLLKLMPLSVALALALNGLAAASNRGASGPVGLPAISGPLGAPSIRTEPSTSWRPGGVILPGEPPAVLPGIGLPAGFAAPAGPAAGAASPAVAPGAAAAGVPLNSISEAVAPQLGAIGAPNASADGSSQAGENLTVILQGGKGLAQGGVSASFAEPGASGASGGAAGSGLAASQPAAPSAKPAPAAPAPASAPKTSIRSRASYELRRLGLSAVSNIFGLVYSLPQAGPSLTAKILGEAAYKDAILSDIDDTLGKYNTVLEQPTVESIVAVRRAGKLFGAITDRPDKTKPNSSQMSAIDSFASIPADKREGIVLATNGGGKIFQYDAQGEPKLIFEEPNLPEAEKALITEAAEAVKAKLASFDAEMKFENHGPYGYGMIFVEGTPFETVKQLAELMESEMLQRGLTYSVEPRKAKNPADPPYFTFSKLNKSLAVKRIMELEKLSTGKTILIGDSMYKPQSPKSLTRMARLAGRIAARLSGAGLPQEGNATDRNMELGMPGAMTLSVGGTADPRMANAYVLDGKGPEVTRSVLAAMATRRAGELPQLGFWRTLGLVLLGMALTAGIVFALYSVVHGMFETANAIDQGLRQGTQGDGFGLPF